jgi:membrane protease YdiL (CAAX protease family)
LTLRDLGWQAGEGQEVWKELAFGAIIGAPLGVLWIYVIEPILSTIQSTVGDYVPAGSLFPALGATILPFAIADVLLAPFVEENIYRGYGTTKLLPRFEQLRSFSGSSWTVTGLADFGISSSQHYCGSFAIACDMEIFWFAFGAHLALNLVETLCWIPGACTPLNNTKGMKPNQSHHENHQNSSREGTAVMAEG